MNKHIVKPASAFQIRKSLNISDEDIKAAKEAIKRVKRNSTGVREIISPNYDWCVVYVNDDKVWEGDCWNTEMIKNTIEALGGTHKLYEFTDENEIDGFTPDKFSDIIGIKEFKD